jgi:hypothetical protein
VLNVADRIHRHRRGARRNPTVGIAQRSAPEIGVAQPRFDRGIDHLTRLGRVGETTDRVETAARTAIEARLRDPYLGGRPLRDPATTIRTMTAIVTTKRMVRPLSP